MPPRELPMRARLGACAAASVCLLCSSPVPAAAQVSTLAPGIGVVQLGAPSAPIRMSAVVVQPKAAAVRVIDAYRTLGPAAGEYNYTLDRLAPHIRAAILINGGFTGSFSVPAPIGLLVAQGRLRSRLVRSSAATGVFCITRQLSWLILAADTYKDGVCSEGLQAGPVLIANGSIAIKQDEPLQRRAYRRSAVCIDNRGALVLVTTSEVSLRALAEALVRRSGQGGLDCRDALNLDGDSSAGMIVRSASYGSTNSTVASAIAVFPAQR